MVTLKTFDGSQVTPEDDSAILKTLLPDGIISGCDFTVSEDNKIHISDGYIVFKGRNIQIVNESFSAKLSPEGTVDGAIYLKMDLNNRVKPITIENEIAKQEYTDNEMLLAKYKATVTGVFELNRTCDFHVTGGYDIGDIFLSFNSKSPAERFGGTWERIEERMLFGASSKYPVDSTGGSKTVSLTGDQNGPHTHSLEDRPRWYTYDSPVDETIYGSNNIIHSKQLHQFTGTSGKGEPHENMPPYISVYIWKRIA